MRQTIVKQTKDTQFQLLYISVLREYLEVDLALGSGVGLDKERLIDDFILMTFLVGNDFLPHLPTLDISEQAFDVIFNAYKALIGTNPGYIVRNGEIGDFKRLEDLFTIIGKQESEILSAREEDVRNFNSRKKKFADPNQPTLEEMEEAEEALQRAYEDAILEALGRKPGNDDEISRTRDAGEALGPKDTAVAVTERAVDDEVLDYSQLVYDDFGEPVIPEPFKAVLNKAKARKLRALDAEERARIRAKSRPRTLMGTFDDVEDADVDGFEDTEPSCAKDYRGRYYFEKFKVLPGTAKSRAYLNKLMESYLEGLMWCLAYYTRGCVSWTWYFPYHYGPMLQDMVNLEVQAQKISFSLGQPFRPFQQLLGCLPPASKNMLPRVYQWLMTDQESPVLEFYPEEFKIDQNGKKTPWEAVVVLPFIDESRLLEAEKAYCKESYLTLDEIRRNCFGKVLSYRFDPTQTETYFSCNPEIGLSDIPNCQSSLTELEVDLTPGQHFAPEVIAGTLSPYPGFPSLAVLSMASATMRPIKINVFGSDSKYRTMVLEVEQKQFDIREENAHLLAQLVGRTVYVNYPMSHEAKVVAVTTETFEYRSVETCTTLSAASSASSALSPTSPPAGVVRIDYDRTTQEKWNSETTAEVEMYLKGRGIPGSGGLAIGTAQIRLRVCVLQGMRRDARTGATKKVFGTTEADVPIQLALLSPVVLDRRFLETDELPLEQLMPFGSTVVATLGQLRGLIGRVVGFNGRGQVGHTADGEADGETDASGGKNGAPAKKGRSKKSVKARTGASGDLAKGVDVEFLVPPPEPPFGHAIATSIRDEYFNSKDVCNALQVLTIT